MRFTAAQDDTCCHVSPNLQSCSHLTSMRLWRPNSGFASTCQHRCNRIMSMHFKHHIIMIIGCPCPWPLAQHSWCHQYCHHSHIQPIFMSSTTHFLHFGMLSSPLCHVHRKLFSRSHQRQRNSTTRVRVPNPSDRSLATLSGDAPRTAEGGARSARRQRRPSGTRRQQSLIIRSAAALPTSVPHTC